MPKKPTPVAPGGGNVGTTQASNLWNDIVKNWMGAVKAITPTQFLPAYTDPSKLGSGSKKLTPTTLPAFPQVYRLPEAPSVLPGFAQVTKPTPTSTSKVGSPKVAPGSAQEAATMYGTGGGSGLGSTGTNYADVVQYLLAPGPSQALRQRAVNPAFPGDPRTSIFEYKTQNGQWIALNPGVYQTGPDSPWYVNTPGGTVNINYLNSQLKEAGSNLQYNMGASWWLQDQAILKFLPRAERKNFGFYQGGRGQQMTYRTPRVQPPAPTERKGPPTPAVTPDAGNWWNNLTNWNM